jgi:hypothetical protein
VTHPRAADDFAMIRARPEELRCKRARPRAADDFATIGARMEELRRERIQVVAEPRDRSVISPKPFQRTTNMKPSMKAGRPSRA